MKFSAWSNAEARALGINAEGLLLAINAEGLLALRIDAKAACDLTPRAAINAEGVG